MRKITVLIAAASVGVLALAGCAAAETDSSDEGAVAADASKICVYTHGDGGTFWSVAQAGAEQAAEDLGVTLDYQGSTNDSARQASMLEAGITGGCDGIAASAPDPGAIEDAMLNAAEAGIPTVTMNSGSEVFRELGAFTHVGQDEIVAGQEAGLRFNEMGVSHILCPIHEAANSGLTDRCAGARETFNGTVDDFNIDGALADLSGASAKILAALQADESIDAIFAVNADVAANAALPAVESVDRDVAIGTVDLSSDTLAAIQDGGISFAIDQQQYAQGYLSVVLLHLALTNDNQLGGGLPIYTGPGFVTAENVDKVLELVESGTR